uniref:Segregation and condensation protein B n=1 Tax=uncultured Armatimonadetes bacterium TaxID=157466 RepID=A0A6J4HA20_9BACT|nr:Segregation and condensation protein B [uncultured Armatimonadetes bacterium]
MQDSLSQIIECLLFVSGEPVSVKDLARTTETDADAVYAAIRTLRDRYVHSGLQIVEIAGGFQLATRPEYAPAVGRLLAPHANRLSRPSLETVTIVAYRQPCTQADIEAVRGVSSDGVLKTLIERGLLKEAGRKPSPGRPILYATTDDFLHYFGLASLSDLPPLDEDEAPVDGSEMATALAAAGVETESA